MTSTKLHSKPFPLGKFLLTVTLSVFYYQAMVIWLDSYMHSFIIVLSFGAMMLVKYLVDNIMVRWFAENGSRTDRMCRYVIYSMLLMASFAAMILFVPWSLSPWTLPAMVLGLVMTLSLLGRDMMFAVSIMWGYLFILIQLVVLIGMTLFAFTHPLIGVGLIVLMVHNTVRYIQLRHHITMGYMSVVGVKTVVFVSVAWAVIAIMTTAAVVSMAYTSPDVYGFMLS